MSGITDIKVLSPTQVQITLSGPNAELPYNFTGDHLAITPDGFEDWMKPIGTGGYKQTSFEPGVRATWTRNENYWRSDRAHADEVEFLIINDPQARLTALQSDQVDAIGLLDAAAADVLKGFAGIQVINSSGGQFWSYSMNCQKAPFTDKNIRLAMKYAIDRQKILDIVLRGNGKVGNDQPLATTDPFFNSELEQRPYDPDKAKYYLKQAGLDSFAIPLDTSDATFANAANVGVLYKQAAEAAGINVDVVRHPADGYWDQVWMNKDHAFTTGVWMGRPTARHADVDGLLQHGALERGLLVELRLRRSPARRARRARSAEAQGHVLGHAGHHPRGRRPYHSGLRRLHRRLWPEGARSHPQPGVVPYGRPLHGARLAGKLRHVALPRQADGHRDRTGPDGLRHPVFCRRTSAG